MLQAKVTTVVVTTALSMLVSINIGQAVLGSVGGSSALGSSGGTSTFQLIQAVQFMNIFGKLFQNTKTQNSTTRRDFEAPGGSNSTDFDSAGIIDNEGTDNDASEFRFEK